MNNMLPHKNTRRRIRPSWSILLLSTALLLTTQQSSLAFHHQSSYLRSEIGRTSSNICRSNNQVLYSSHLVEPRQKDSLLSNDVDHDDAILEKRFNELRLSNDCYDHNHHQQQQQQQQHYKNKVGSTVEKIEKSYAVSTSSSVNENYPEHSDLVESCDRKSESGRKSNSRFGFRKNAKKVIGKVYRIGKSPMKIFSSVKNDTSATVLRSSSSIERKSSRFGVRRRVRSIIKKAKTCIGRNNLDSCEEESRTDIAAMETQNVSIEKLAIKNDFLLRKEQEEKEQQEERCNNHRTIENSLHHETAAGFCSETYAQLMATLEHHSKDDQKAMINIGSLEEEIKKELRIMPVVKQIHNAGPLEGEEARTAMKAEDESSKRANITADDIIKMAHTIEAMPVSQSDDSASDATYSESPDSDSLPFDLPSLSSEQQRSLLAGERIQEQSRMGREGSGFVVVDVKAEPSVIWNSLLDYENYPNMMNTVRSMKLEEQEEPSTSAESREECSYGIPSITRASFVLSKFRLKVAAIHNYITHNDGDYMIFSLDQKSKNLILRNAKGIWYTQSNPDNRGKEFTRVWLLCELKCSRVLPNMIVDYASKKAMPRATKWLKPYVEEKARKNQHR